MPQIYQRKGIMEKESFIGHKIELHLNCTLQDSRNLSRFAMLQGRVDLRAKSKHAVDLHKTKCACVRVCMCVCVCVCAAMARP